jgi:hypothetical protein
MKEFAGHASSTTTDRYMYLMLGALRTAIAPIKDESV